MIRFGVWASLLIAGVLIAIWSANDGSPYNGLDLLAAVLVVLAIWRLSTIPDPNDIVVVDAETPQEHS